MIMLPMDAYLLVHRTGSIRHSNIINKEADHVNTSKSVKKLKKVSTGLNADHEWLIKCFLKICNLKYCQIIKLGYNNSEVTIISMDIRKGSNRHCSLFTCLGWWRLFFSVQPFAEKIDNHLCRNRNDYCHNETFHGRSPPCP